MFGNVPNNNSNRQSVNTRSVVLYGEVSCLTVTWWDDKMSLKINPLLNVDSEGKRNYDTEKRVLTLCLLLLLLGTFPNIFKSSFQFF